MSSIRLPVALAIGLLGWFHHSAWAQPRSAAGSKREFAVFDATLYKQKPDLAHYGLRPVSMVFQQNMWPAGNNGANLPDKDAVNKFIAKAAKTSSVIVLDIEQWPLTGDSAVVGPNVTKYATLIQWAKQASPSSKIGYYGVAPIRDYWDAILAANSPKYIAWQKENDRVAPVAQLADYLFPSIYTFYSDQAGWTKYAIQQIKEARRYVGNKPVYVFLWNEFHTSTKQLAGTYIPPDYWTLELDTAWKYADGLVIWGGYTQTWDETAPWWVATKKFLQRIGPTGASNR